jgi:hypothetical protein
MLFLADFIALARCSRMWRVAAEAQWVLAS